MKLRWGTNLVETLGENERSTQLFQLHLKMLISVPDFQCCTTAKFIVYEMGNPTLFGEGFFFLFAERR